MSKEYWNGRYAAGADSGYGSYGEQLIKKLNWIKPLEFDSISELGCGDFNFGKRILEMKPDSKYWGTDISEVVVEKNQRLYPYATFTTDREIPKADLVMCVDVLFHVHDEKEVESILTRLETAWTKYLIITAYERDATEKLASHVVIRKFDPKRFGEPILREVVEEDGSLYFYIFKRG